MNKALAYYQVAVQHPEVSGFEVLEMLMVRDKLAKQETALTRDEKTRLAKADQQLLTDASAFYGELAQITDLVYERQQRQPTPAQWWWYLDVLTQLPQSAGQSQELVPVFA